MRDVHPERRVTRALMWEDAGPTHNKDLPGCSLWQEDGDVHAAVKKRPGRYSANIHYDQPSSRCLTGTFDLQLDRLDDPCFNSIAT